MAIAWSVGSLRRDDLLLCYFGFLNDSKEGEELMLADGPPGQGRLAGAPADDRRPTRGASDPTNAAYL